MATTHPATPAQAVLALYGALDHAASAGNADIEATVARYLPRTTGTNAGWYEKLLVFLGHRESQFTHTASVPDLGDALSVLQQQAAPQPAPAPQAVSKKAARTPKKGTAVTRGVTGTPPTPPEPDRPLSTVQKARMVFAIATLSQLPGWYLQNVLGATWETQLDNALGLVRGPKGGLFDHLRLNLNSRDGYPKVIEVAGSLGLVDPKVALVPLCQPKVMIVRQHLCLVITTEFSSDAVSLNELKDVIDPANWARCLSTFFCDMYPQRDRDDGWARVLEQVSTTCPILPTHMKTPLKYWKTEGSDDATKLPTACLEYELDEQPDQGAEGDGLIVLDEGFIRMTSTGSGVRVRTRKVVGFRNSAITPLGVLACSMGYGDQGIDMILDGVENRKERSDKLQELEGVDVAAGQGSESTQNPSLANTSGTGAGYESSCRGTGRRDGQRMRRRHVRKNRGCRCQVGERESADHRDDRAERRIYGPGDHRPLALFGAAAKPGAEGR